MEPYGRSGSMIGRTLDFGATDRYVSGYTTVYDTLTYVGGSVHIFAGTASNVTVPLNTLTGGTNTAPQAGDLVILVLGVGGVAGLTYRLSSFTQIGSYGASHSESTALQIGYKIMGSTPDTSATILGGSGSTSFMIGVGVHVWRGFDTANVLDTAVVPATVINTGIPNPNGIITVTPGAQVIIAAASGHIGGPDSYTAPYLSNFRTSGANGVEDVTIGIGSILRSSPGSYDGAAWGWTQVDSTSYSNISIVVAIRPGSIQVPILGNYRNSGVWDLPAVYNNKIG